MGLRISWLAVVLLTVSCSGSSVAVQTPPPTDGPPASYSSPLASSATTSSTMASPPPNAPLCRLPVVSWEQQYLARQAGFIDTATGTYTADLSGVMVSDESTGLDHTPDHPYLYGLGGSSYNPAHHRWVPVPREYGSPGGAAYAYAARQAGPTPGGLIVALATL